MTVLKIYVNLSKISVLPRISVHSNDLFSETNALFASVVLKFYIQHDKAAGLQTDKVQPDRE